MRKFILPTCGALLFVLVPMSQSFSRQANAVPANVAISFSDSCSNYVKPALCVSHSECKWTGSCVHK